MTSTVDSGVASAMGTASVLNLIRDRHSSRGDFNPDREVSAPALARVLEAARWAPTPNNMQNFQVVVVDDPEELALIGKIPADMSEAYLKENYALISASEAELRIRKIGTLASVYPRAWTDPEAWDPESDYRSQLTYLGKAMRQPKVLLVVLYDAEARAPGSDGDTLGFMGLGCVMENMWLVVESLGLSMHVLSVFSDGQVEAEMRHILEIAPSIRIGFACSLGYCLETGSREIHVRRDLEDFVHHNVFGKKDIAWTIQLNGTP